ncbi:hypothetical protein PLICRDRAFT_171711 [Plicaturopsis crispa FD-325 SS-3]|nr:hypothetical protein PLICRDRAFT_171711 [Plicaturopsis crispa FD-325 SS-3]
MTNDPTVQLNNYLQSRGELTLLSWQESNSGPAHAVTWTCVCKIGGVPRGTGTGSLKHIAKNAAAAQALKALTEENA